MKKLIISVLFVCFLVPVSVGAWQWPVLQEERIGDYTLTITQSVAIEQVIPMVFYRIDTVLWLTEPSGSSNIIWSNYYRRATKKSLKQDARFWEDRARIALEARKEAVKELGR